MKDLNYNIEEEESFHVCCREDPFDSNSDWSLWHTENNLFDAIVMLEDYQKIYSDPNMYMFRIFRINKTVTKVA